MIQEVATIPYIEMPIMFVQHIWREGSVCTDYVANEGTMLDSKVVW